MFYLTANFRIDSRHGVAFAKLTMKILSLHCGVSVLLNNIVDHSTPRISVWLENAYEARHLINCFSQVPSLACLPLSRLLSIGYSDPSGTSDSAGHQSWKPHHPSTLDASGNSGPAVENCISKTSSSGGTLIVTVSSPRYEMNVATAAMSIFTEIKTFTAECPPPPGCVKDSLQETT